MDELRTHTHPMQPIAKDEHGTLRFKPNAIVQYLLDHNGNRVKIDMNALAVMDFSVEDREQFAQLIGYSLNGFAELSYVRDVTFEAAKIMSEQLDPSEDEARIAALESMIEKVREGIRIAASALFPIHPDDLNATG